MKRVLVIKGIIAAVLIAVICAFMFSEKAYAESYFGSQKIIKNTDYSSTYYTKQNGLKSSEEENSVYVVIEKNNVEIKDGLGKESSVSYIANRGETFKLRGCILGYYLIQGSGSNLNYVSVNHATTQKINN